MEGVRVQFLILTRASFMAFEGRCYVLDDRTLMLGRRVRRRARDGRTYHVEEEGQQ